MGLLEFGIFILYLYCSSCFGIMKYQILYSENNGKEIDLFGGVESVVPIVFM